MSISRRNLLQVTASGALLAGCADGRPSGAAPAPAPSASEATPTSKAPSPSRTTPGTSAALPPLPPGLPDQIEHGPRDRPRLALTFHGQGEPAQAEALLTEAEKAGARVTVLAVGSWLDTYPRLARRILDGGHELGNHTQTHGDIGAMDAAAATAEIEGCAERLRKLTGSRGRWFRPSQARMATPLVVRLAQRAGYPHLLSYDVDPLDYTDPGAGQVRAAVAAQARAGSVVSLHFGHSGTVAALPGILDDLHRRGLRAVTTSELLT
ncbi:Peptidoglycan/xylan/chitin deacetylase, PgdA/CDA1 family [Actinacidiphila alni]|uniref:Peptidoglycan/xylan/chitin deacetylase, PgdA/CDA1 family n=1 Tax=Actinacidiphila alni TaxID=380248 RepID=A0A1I2F670_9ACTN|nr:polysaccharide deacetylase family protein [Actinacidiphila alni]SFF00469.1 Peptidoglycan/xylan/chitin deacetylase, PgdA/CDA1 family [Actinacidiphila alni]